MEWVVLKEMGLSSGFNRKGGSFAPSVHARAMKVQLDYLSHF